jgi:ribonuclease E
VSEANAGTDAERDSRRRRRRRGGRGRDGEASGTNGESQDGVALEGAEGQDDAPTEAGAPDAAGEAPSDSRNEPTGAAQVEGQTEGRKARPRREPEPAAASETLSDATPAVTVVAPAPAGPEPIRVEPFVLDLAALTQIAETAGLSWVNSDGEKIRAAQEAIAAEPQPVHAPRERQALVVEDVGPLILVETRKDLSALRLPFDEAASSDV